MLAATTREHFSYFTPKCFICQEQYTPDGFDNDYLRFAHPNFKDKNQQCNYEGGALFIHHNVADNLQNPSTVSQGDWWVLIPIDAALPEFVPLMRIQFLHQIGAGEAASSKIVNSYKMRAIKYTVPSWALGSILVTNANSIAFPVSSEDLITDQNFDLDSLIHSQDSFFLWADRSVLQEGASYPVQYAYNSTSSAFISMDPNTGAAKMVIPV